MRLGETVGGRLQCHPYFWLVICAYGRSFRHANTHILSHLQVSVQSLTRIIRPFVKIPALDVL